MSECEHDWIEMDEAEGSGFYDLCLKCGAGKPADE